jgi:uncharacterized protein (DUF433 family)
MSRYPLNLPASLKHEAEALASQQGISLNQFIMWSVSEKVTSLRQNLDDPDYPGITYRRGASGWVAPVLRGTGIRVQTIVVYAKMGTSVEELATQYELEIKQVKEALTFYEKHRLEIDANIEAEAKMMEAARGEA